MKLIDILARSLREFPREAEAIAQDHDGYVNLWKTKDINFYSGEWNSKDGCGLLDYEWSLGRQRIAEDHATTVITREQWQAAVDALKVPAAWNGEGLPPVGTIAENESGIQFRIITTIKQKSGDLAVGQIGENGELRLAEAGYWRPARTAEQIAADEREAEILSIVNDILPVQGEVTRVIAVHLHSIGYRKQVAQ